jgi:hypothetical protein
VPGPGPDEAILISTQELSHAIVNRVQQSGTVKGTGESFLLVADRAVEPGHVTFKVRVGTRDLPTLRFPERRFPALDLPSTRVNAGTRQGTAAINVEIRFGEERECFRNDDGRDRLRIGFRQGKVSGVEATRFSNCEPEIEEFEEGAFVVANKP